MNKSTLSHIVKVGDKVAIYRRRNCRLCNSTELELVLKLAPMPIGDDYVSSEHLGKVQECYPIDLFLCKRCGLSQLLDALNQEEVYRNYIYRTSDSLGLVEHFRKYADGLMHQINPQKEALVLEIGSNDGSFLNFFKMKGMRVLGIDPAVNIAKNACKKGIETLSEFFTLELAQKIRNNYGPACIITANNTFANIDDLAGITKGIRHLLHPDGVFVFETGYFVDLIQKLIFDNIYHEHLSYFTVKPLEAFFSENDMELINVERVPTKGGSIRCTAQLKGGPRKASNSVKGLIKLEDELKVHKSEKIEAFGKRLANTRNELLEILNNLKSKGKKIAGYGASVGATTVLYNFNLDKTILDFIADDNPNRQNLYSPGFHVPVLHPKWIYDRKIDFVVILAWQYAGPIIRKHQAYLDRGGQFITFLPKLEIIGKKSLGL